MTPDPYETILKMGAEGGSLTIFGKRKATGAWQFRVERDETTLYDMLSEEDRAGAVPFEQNPWIESLDAVLAQIDRYNWPRLYPMSVHPDFRDYIFKEVQKRGGDSEVARWRRTVV